MSDSEWLWPGSNPDTMHEEVDIGRVFMFAVFLVPSGTPAEPTFLAVDHSPESGDKVFRADRR